MRELAPLPIGTRFASTLVYLVPGTDYGKSVYRIIGSLRSRQLSVWLRSPDRRSYNRKPHELFRADYFSVLKQDISAISLWLAVCIYTLSDGSGYRLIKKHSTPLRLNELQSLRLSALSENGPI